MFMIGEDARRAHLYERLFDLGVYTYRSERLELTRGHTGRIPPLHISQNVEFAQPILIEQAQVAQGQSFVRHLVTYSKLSGRELVAEP